MEESFNSTKPYSEFIKKYISYYYFHECEKPTKVSFSYYPNYENALTVYKNSNLEKVSNSETRVLPGGKGYSYIYSQLFKGFAKADIQGPFNKIGIVFKPLGINHFINDSLSNLIDEELNVHFNYFQNSFSPILDSVFAEKNIESKTQQLDAYFLEQFRDFQDKRLIAALELLFEPDEKLSVQLLSQQLNINRKTLLRLFKRHLNCSPKEYITLIQFRTATELYQNASQKPSLTRLAFDLDYYDQSDFIHRFVKITGTNPKKFFDTLKKYGTNSTFWSPE